MKIPQIVGPYCIKRSKHVNIHIEEATVKTWEFRERVVESMPSALEDMLMGEDLPKTLSVTYKERFKKTKCREC